MRLAKPKKVLGTPKNLIDGTSRPLTGKGTVIDLSSAIFWGTLLQSSLEAVALSDRPQFAPGDGNIFDFQAADHKISVSDFSCNCNE